MARKRKNKGLGAQNATVGAIELAKNWDKIYGTAGASTPPIAGLAGGYGADVATGAANAFPTGATAVDLGTSGATSALGQAIPALGQAYALWSLAKQGIQSGTFNSWVHPGTNMPTDYQRNTILAAADASRDVPGGPVTTPDEAHALPEGWNIPYVNGKFLSPQQMTKLMKGKTLGSGQDEYRYNPETGQIEYVTAHEGLIEPGTGPLQPGGGEGALSDPGIVDQPSFDGQPTVGNNEGSISTPNWSDIINAGGSGTPGSDMGDYENYPTTGGVTGGTTIPEAAGPGSNDAITAGAGGLAAWLASKGLGGLSNLLGSFGDLPTWAKIALGAGAAGTIGSMVGGNREYKPDPPPKFPGQPTKLPQSYAPRTPIAPNTDYYTYGQRPEQAFFSNVPPAPTPSPLAQSAPDTGGNMYTQALIPATVNGIHGHYTDGSRTNFIPNPGNTPNPSTTINAAKGGALSRVRPSRRNPLSQVSRYVKGSSSGRKDDVDAKLSHGEYVFDAETVALLGDGNNEAGADRLDQWRKNLRSHKGKALAKGRFSPNAKDPSKYLRNA